MNARADALRVSTSRPGLGERLRALYERRETIRFLVVSQLKAGHRDKVLGHLWNLLDPLLFAGVYYFVFGVLFGQTARGRGVDFLVYLLVGVFAWRFTEASVMGAAGCIRGRRGLIHEINFPKAIFPISICFARLYDFLWGLLALFLVLLALGRGLSLHLIWVPGVVALHLVFACGLAFIVAYLGAFFADTSNVVSVAIRLWFYCSPLFYYVSDVVGPNGKVVARGLIPERYQTLFMLNPMAGFFEAYRNCLLYAAPPDVSQLAYLGAVSVVTLAAGFVVFGRGEGTFAKYI